MIKLAGVNIYRTPFLLLLFGLISLGSHFSWAGRTYEKSCGQECLKRNAHKRPLFSKLNPNHVDIRLLGAHKCTGKTLCISYNINIKETTKLFNGLVVYKGTDIYGDGDNHLEPLESANISFTGLPNKKAVGEFLGVKFCGTISIGSISGRIYSAYLCEKSKIHGISFPANSLIIFSPRAQPLMDGFPTISCIEPGKTFTYRGRKLEPGSRYEWLGLEPPQPVENDYVCMTNKGPAPNVTIHPPKPPPAKSGTPRELILARIETVKKNVKRLNEQLQDFDGLDVMTTTQFLDDFVKKNCPGTPPLVWDSVAGRFTTSERFRTTGDCQLLWNKEFFGRLDRAYYRRPLADPGYQCRNYKIPCRKSFPELIDEYQKEQGILATLVGNYELSLLSLELEPRPSPKLKRRIESLKAYALPKGQLTLPDFKRPLIYDLIRCGDKPHSSDSKCRSYKCIDYKWKPTCS